jgi:hypothetical protein
MECADESSLFFEFSGDDHSTSLSPQPIDLLQLVGVHPWSDLLFVLVVVVGFCRLRKQGVGEDDHIFVVPLALVVIRPSGEGVCSSVGLPCYVVYLDGVVSKFDYFSRYPTTDLLWVSPVLQVEVIRIYLDLVGGSRKQRSRVSEGFYDRQEF